MVYWLGDHYQTYLLVQSILMVITQFGLLYVCLKYRPHDWDETRPYRIANFWQWPNFGAYLEFSAILVVVHSVLFLLLHRFTFYIQLLGLIALGLEATLPIPQVLANYHAKSTAGFRSSVLAGWCGGDAFKLVYFFVTPNPWQFRACASFQFGVDIILCIQTFLFRHKTAADLRERAGDTAGVAGADALLQSRGDGHKGGEETEDETSDESGDEERRAGGYGRERR
ncbi:PQ-loop protein [Rhodotorula toruloides]|uniref:PQ-loop protein n=1 Tax=Rhodotorula toruloides TaxID=5286 RepID=A0A511KB11_RHOTO|nr:PQ-loop protein [Rhodotorula toruloides]